MKARLQLVLAVLIAFGAGILCIQADELFQDFENYQDVGGGNVRYTGTYTNSAGWIVSDGRVRDYGIGYSYSPTNAAWFENDGDYPNAWLQTPLMTNGVGSLIFWARNMGVSSIDFQILTNGSLFTTLTSTNDSGWSKFTVVLNIYTSVYVRIFKSQQTAGGQWLGLDDVETIEAPAKVDISDVVTDPDIPEVNDPVTVSCTIAPSTLASNISAATYYRIGASGPFTAIGMVTNGLPNDYITTNTILGQQAGIQVQYYIEADFLGPYAMSPTNYPAAGSNGPAFYVVQERPFLTSYKYMNVLGSGSTNMTLVDDYQWQGVLNTTGALTNAEFRFEGISTNLVTTNFWGDNDQQRFDLPVAETADPGPTNIVVSAMESDSQFLFRLHETNLSYSVRQCAYQDFDVWTNAESPGNYSNNGWYAHDVFIKKDDDRKHTLKACFLSNDVSSIMSPCLTDGIGEISFWYRNGETDGDPLPTLYIQKSKTGGTNSDEWVTIQTNTVSVTNYVRHILPANDRYYNYVRIKNGTNGWICLDEILTAYPGAGVIMTNLVHSPEFPQVDDSVNLFVDVELRAGASNRVVTAYYRSGVSGPFTNSISMSHTVGNTYVSVSPVPAGMGGGEGGAGTVQYYVSCTFEGYESEYATQPIAYPEGGSNSPAAYWITPFNSDYTNMSVTGPFNTDLILIDDYVWQGVASFTTSIINAQFQFSGVNGSTTNWGDINQPVFDLPVNGAAETGASNIVINGTNTGHFVFHFNETNLEYSVQRCAYVNFDDWSTPYEYSSYTNSENWVIVNGRTTHFSWSTDLRRIFRGRSCYLRDTGEPQYLRSPNLTNGIGEISFWYRNWEEDEYPKAGFYVQVSEDGASGWETVAMVTNIVTMDYTHFSFTLCDWYNHYVRILNSTNSTHARLCLDEIIIAEPWASVMFSGLSNSPALPTILDAVNIFVNIEPKAHATNLNAKTWYRGGTNGIFDSTPMTNISGTLFRTLAPIPSGGTGVMHYCVECSYTGYGSEETSPAYYPPGGSNNPAAYTNTDVIVMFQDFENYQDVGGGDVRYTGTYTNSAGWIVSDGRVRNYGGGFSYSPTNAAWFENDGDYPNAWLQTPLMTNGVGSLIFWARNMGVSSIEFQILTNGSLFTTLTSTNDSGWTKFTVVLNIYTPVSVRIFKSEQTAGGQWLGLDDVTITYPPAQVAFTNMMIHPGYPTSNQTVDVSVYITSARTNPLAFNIDGTLYYRLQGGSWQAPIPMTKSGDYFLTSGSIPAYSNNAVIQYYVKSTFNGYYHQSTNMSPMYYPAGGANSPASYTVRGYASDYSNVLVAANVGTVTMELIDNNYWQGVMDISHTTNQLVWSFSGFGHYTNMANAYGAQDSWGDSWPSRTNLPISGVAQTNGSSIVINGIFEGQIVFRYNDADNSYLVKRCVYQDFNNWTASADYFEESVGFSTVTWTTNHFNNWATNQVPAGLPATSLDDFMGFAISTNWETAKFGSKGWYVDNAWILAEIDADQACRLKPVADNGAVWPHHDTLTDGLKDFKFDYRATFPDNYYTWHTGGTNWNNYYVEAQITVTNISPAFPYVSMFARFQNETNYYEYRLQRTATNKIGISIWQHSGGATNQIGSTSTNTVDFLNTTHTCRLIAVTNNNGYVYLEAWYNGAQKLYGNSYYDTSGTRISGPGSIGFLTSEGDIKVDNVTVRRMDIQRFEQWTTGGYGTYTNAGWVVSNGQVRDADDDCQLNQNTATSQTFNAWLTNDYGNWGTYTNSGWLLSDGRISATNGYQSSPNAAWLANYASQYTNSYLRTPCLSNGLGYITFYCKNTGTNSIEFKVQTSPNGADTWSTFTTQTNTTTGSWTPYSVGIHTTNAPIYARIFKSQMTGEGHWLGLDDVYVTHSPSRPHITSPYLNYNVGSLSFEHYTYYVNPGVAQCEIKASSNYVDWVTVGAISNTSTAWLAYDLPTNDIPNLPDYRYFRIANPSTNYAYIRKIYITGSTNGASATNTVLPYSQDFASGATNWSAPYGFWNAANGTYNRAGYCGPAIGLKVQKAYTNGVAGSYPLEGQWIDVESFTASNLVYQTRTTVFHNWDELFVRLKHTDAAASVVVDNMTITRWRGTNYMDSNNWIATESWVAPRDSTNTDNHCVEFWRSRADTNADQHLRTPWMTNGVGEITFDLKTGSTNVQFEIQRSSYYPNTNLFEEGAGALTNITLMSASWTNFNLPIRDTNSLYVRILHASTNIDSILYIDNVRLKNYPPRDSSTWVAYNAKITANENSREYESGSDVKTCYLNNSPDTDTAGSTYNEYMPHVQSPYMANGIGEIGFWYRNWQANGSPSAKIYIRSATNNLAPLQDWTNICELSGVVNTQQYYYFSTNIYITDHHYLRIYCETDSTARACLDNVLITEPAGADLDIANLTITPAVPLFTNTVRVSADLTHYLFSPSNINLRAYYHIGTNNWASWTTNDFVPLYFQTNISGTRTYTSSIAIPAQGIDTVVQYYVSCAFDGTFAEKASPKQYKQFTNPNWYDPVDLNRTHGKTNPYYFVFSCPTGFVWINEFNIWDGYYLLTRSNQYVELCGKANSIISNWWIQVLNPSFVTTAVYRITNNAVLANETNGYGFWVIGSNCLSGLDLDMFLTNTLPDSGGIRLMRSMGAFEYGVSYGTSGASMTNNPAYGFVAFAGVDDGCDDFPVALIETGSYASDFTWSVSTGPFTPGSMNGGQILVGTGENEPPPLVEIEITDFWLTGTNVWIVCTGTNDWKPTAWYSTNLVNTNWFLVTNSQYTYSSGIFTQWFDLMTNSQSYFYKVIATNTP